MSIGLGNDIVVGRRMGVRLTGGGGSSLDADAAALIAAMTTTPDATRQGHINTLITGLKADGVWAKLDELWVTAAHAEQAALLGWKRYKNLTAVNAPTFTVDRGFAGNGTTSYLNTNFVPSTDGVQYTLNDASFGVYSRTNSNGTFQDIGSRDAPNANMANLFAKTSNSVLYYANQDVTSTDAHALASTGLWLARRPSASVVQAWRNGASVVERTTGVPSTGRPQYAMYIGANNVGGTASQFSARQYAAAFVGAAMSEAQQLALYNRIQTYMTAVGANV